ncbi:hypothetical protein CIL05_14325 [Virgibacillus profundi]|uniref:Lipoprotein n=1 Tax=Virgibacillus profundi TaxID=2024555 RepID=A0A2A2ICE2_9BACI|nr:hypothetical protein [Virgibacillus profundi]PAV28800.1 hypothetical protein CIL05_14325 [Virgibacillus profundi]PXY52968.1 hypothetical protein CIT14_14450 [Virgibacillus profundi]
MKKILSILILILLAACVKEEPAIEKTDTVTDDPSNEPELVEEVNENEDEVEEYIEFAFEDEQIRINLKMVPILDAYLNAVNDRQTAIEKMEIERIYADSPSMYLLEFSCQNNLCSYLLFNSNADTQTYLLADLAKSVSMIGSPDHTKMLFLFQRNSSLPLPLTNMVVIDLEAWEPLPLINETTDSNILDYTWPLISAEWIDNETISAAKPAVLEPSGELINEWLVSEGSIVTNIVLRISHN